MGPHQGVATVYAARAIRDFGDGFVAILLPVYLTALGLSPLDVGVVATLALFGSALLHVAGGGYAPNRVVAASNLESGATAVPLLEDRSRLGGRPTAYVCRGFACRLPVTDPDALREQLAEVSAAV